MKQLLLPALLAALLTQTAPAFATASATATIDWSSFKIEYIDLSSGINIPTFSWAMENGYVAATGHSHPSEDFIDGGYSANDFTTSLSALAITANTQASSIRDVSTIQARASTQPSTVSLLNGANWNYGFANAYNRGGFALAGHGIAIITLDWSVTVSSTPHDASEYSSAGAYIRGDFTDTHFNYGSAQSGTLLHSYEGGGEFSESGTFIMAVISTGGVNGNIYAEVNAFAQSPVVAVPEPETYAMLLVGLGLLGVVAKRRRQSFDA